jgi:hypothetical protein
MGAHPFPQSLDLRLHHGHRRLEGYDFRVHIDGLAIRHRIEVGGRVHHQGDADTDAGSPGQSLQDGARRQ